MNPKSLFLFFVINRSPTQAAHGEDYSVARRAVAVAVSSHQNAEALRLLEPLFKAHPQDPSLWTLRGMALDAPDQTKASIEASTGRWRSTGTICRRSKGRRKPLIARRSSGVRICSQAADRRSH